MVARALDAPRRGLTKDGGQSELLAALGAVLAGLPHVSSHVNDGAAPEVSEARCLALRRMQTLELIALGFTSKEVARRLSISIKSWSRPAPR